MNNYLLFIQNFIYFAWFETRLFEFRLRDVQIYRPYLYKKHESHFYVMQELNWILFTGLVLCYVIVEEHSLLNVIQPGYPMI